MVRIAPVNLYYNPKTLWFDPRDLDIHKGDALVVLTARGLEFGRATADVFEADEEQVKKLKTALKPVKRLATEEDIERAEEMERKSAEALPIFKEMAAEASDDMHPVSVEYLLDGDKAVFYFEAEERVDFRDLVRKLAARFHVRIDMRQIGVRDEARMVGGLGHCGQELCCKRMGGEFCPVSIRMAKEQDLSLNPQKISGVCGRLMCCLRYEFDAYKDFKSRAPKHNAMVDTPEGPAKVVDLDVPREIVSLRLDGEKPVKVPLADFDPPTGESNRPNSVGEEAWERATAQDPLGLVSESSFLTSQFTNSDKLADPAQVSRVPGGRNEKKQSGRGGRGGQGSNGSGAGNRGGRGGASSQSTSSSSAAQGSGSEGRKPRRRRSTKVGGDEPVRAEGQSSASEQGGTEATKPKRGGGMQPSRKKKNQAGKQQSSRGAEAAKPQGQKKRSGSGQGGQNQGAQGGAKQGPRPGQKSSGLRQQRGGNERTDAQASRGDGAPTGDGGRRRSRRRSHKAGGTAESGKQE